MNILIIGIGRIGRHILRECLDNYSFNNISIYDLNQNLESLCYFLNYDSSYFLKNERFIVDSSNKEIIDTKNDKKIIFLNPKDFNGDFIIDSSGSADVLNTCFKLGFKTYLTHSINSEKIDHYVIPNISGKVNGKIISMSICDVCSSGPVLNMINSKYEIESGAITTMHPWLNYQNLSDNYLVSSYEKNQFWHQYHLGRKATESLISKETSLVEALCLALPFFKDKLHAWSYRVPTPVVATAILSINLKFQPDNKNNFIRDLLSIPGVIEGGKNKISNDYIGLKEATALDTHNLYINNKFINLKLWYDNEIGYVSQVLKYISNNEEV